MIKYDGSYCACYESGLPGVGRTGRFGEKSVNARSSDRIENFGRSFEEWTKIPEMSKADFIAHLRAYGIEAHEIELLYNKFYRGMTFTEIVEQGGWTSAGACSNVYKRTLRKLKQRGFSFEG